ncbi:MAG: MFS transporter, partial [Actinomycetia bacterium]|nr:MFS transporter [Actinomycetes bacterium]
MKQILHTSVWALFAQHRDLRIVLPARALSMLGDQVTLVVLLLRIGERLTALHVTVLLMAFALPLFALAPLAGRIVDEHDSRRVLVAAGCVQVAASIALVLSPNFVLTIGAVLVLQAGQAVSAPA